MKRFYLFLFCFLVFCLVVSFACLSFAAEPKIVSKLQSGFEDIEGWILKLATPAAAVAVGTGVFMRKFSFGDEERIRLGKKLIRNSLFSYGFILAIDLILSAIKALISQGYLILLFFYST